MKRWLPGLLVLALAALVAMPSGAAAQAKDTLTVALPSHAPTLDPHMHFERVGILVNINMFDSLLHRSAKLEFEPSLALSWKALNDTTWEFKLRKGVKFHNGETMTAEDVKFSFDRVLEPGKEKKKSPQYGNVRAIKEVKIVNADTIHLITDKPFPLLLERVVFFPIVPKKHVEKVGDEAFGSTATVVPGSSWSGSATSTSGSRRSISTGAGSRPSSTSSSGRSPRWRPRWPSSRRAASTSSAT